MAPSFVFEPASDEEVDNSGAEEEEQQQSDQEPESGNDDGEEEERRGRSKPSRSHSQSPWDFASYSESVAEEHARRSTTSVDFKISKALQQRSVPVAGDGGDEESESSESEQDRQVMLSLWTRPNPNPKYDKKMCDFVLACWFY